VGLRGGGGGVRDGGFEVRVQGVGHRDWGVWSGVRVGCLGFGVQGSGIRVDVGVYRL